MNNVKDLQTIEETLKYLQFDNWEQSAPGLARSRELLGLLGNPEQKLKFVHIAGTNGKGSTAAMLASVLQRAGYRTGLYTSPHLLRFHERMRVNGEEIDDNSLISLTNTVRNAAESMSEMPTGFEIMTAIACQAVYDARDLAKTADIAAAMTCQALHGIRKAFDPKVHALRGQPGQITAAENLRRLLEGSQLSFALNPDKVQDAYAIRCTPQIHGASRDAIGYVWDAVSREINAVTDNPLIFPEEDEVISGGNFHGQPMALAMDFLGIAVAEFANVSERRLERLVNPALSEGLPAFLTKHGGVHSGFMIAQYAAASMVSESKVYAHPASVDSIPSSANQEDHVSMGTTAARKALMILDNSQKVLAIELFAGAQALWLRDEDKLSPATRAVYDRIRTVIPPIEEDVVMHPLMVRAEELVKEHALSQAAEAVCGELK